MEEQIRIAFRGMDVSKAVEQAAREKVEKLSRFYPRITNCRVVIELTNHRRRQGRLYHVKIVLNVPNEEIVIGRNHDLNHAYEDVYVALRDAFDAAKRQLQDHVGRTSRNKRVVHIKPPHAHVKRLMYEEGGYGFLETKEGRELYFNRNAVLHRAFDRLKIGSEVRFDEELGEEGPQATTVELVA